MVCQINNHKIDYVCNDTRFKGCRYFANKRFDEIEVNTSKTLGMYFSISQRFFIHKIEAVECFTFLSYHDFKINCSVNNLNLL